MKKIFFLAVIFLSSISLAASEGSGSDFPFDERKPQQGSPASPLCLRKVLEEQSEFRQDPDIVGVTERKQKMLVAFRAHLERRSSVSSEGERGQSPQGSPAEGQRK